MEETPENGNKETERKHRDKVSLDPEAKLRNVEAMLAQMHSECEYKRQQWEAEREAECLQWENDNHLWDKKCGKLEAQHQQGTQEKLELTDQVMSLKAWLADILHVVPEGVKQFQNPQEVDR